MFFLGGKGSVCDYDDNNNNDGDSSEATLPKTNRQRSRQTDRQTDRTDPCISTERRVKKERPLSLGHVTDLHADVGAMFSVM